MARISKNTKGASRQRDAKPGRALMVENLAVIRGRCAIELDRLAMSAGDMTVLRGPNGSGKSTLLRAVAGRLAGAQGDVDCRAPRLYVGHANALAPTLSARRNLADWAGLNGAARDNDTIDAALSCMDARGFADMAVRHLSFGQARRVALARLALGPGNALWLLDEPNAGLDDAARGRLERLVAAHLAGGGMVLASTHLPLGAALKPHIVELAMP